MKASGQRRWRHDAPCPRHVLAVREFLLGVHADLCGGHREDACGTAPWETFVPTTLRLRPVLDDPSVSITSDVDSLACERFVTGIKAVETVRHYPSARLQQIAVRSYLAMPALIPERPERSAYLESSGHPFRVVPRTSFDRVEMVFDFLTRRERLRLSYVPIDEQVALAAVLCAPERSVAAFSSDGEWPRHPLILGVAGRIRSLIVRRSLDEVPLHVQRHIRFLRYQPCEASV